MQNIYKSIALPSIEYVRLQQLMLTMIGSRTAFASLLRRKLGSAGPVSPSAVAADVAVSGRHVHFRIDGQHSEARVLTWQSQRVGDSTNLSLLSSRGLALLGLGPGESVSYSTDSGRTEFLELELVTDGEDHAAERKVKRTKGSRLGGVPDGTRIAAPKGAIVEGLDA